MKTSKKTPQLTADQIDDLVSRHANDDAAWEAPVRVDRARASSLRISGELLARAAFLAKLHHESKVEKWLERIIRERVELEELAFSEAKRQLAS